MSYIGSTPTTQSFIAGTDYFNGTGSQTAFTLSRSVVSVNDIEVVINNVEQQPNTAYTVSGTTITFTSAPSAGTANIYVRYLSTTTQAITPSQGTVSYSTMDSNMQAKQGISFKNKIINGAMVIDQRNAGASSSRAASSIAYSVDRWVASNFTDGVYTVQQTTDVPSNGNFAYSLKATVTTADSSITTTQNAALFQFIEGYNTSDLRFGFSNASSITVSFWVKSTVTGTFSCAITNNDNSRNNPQAFTVNTSNTWEQKTVTFTGDQTGTWLTTNGVGIALYFWMSLGPTYLGSAGWTSSTIFGVTGQANAMSTVGNVFAITGVQLEVGTQATTFDYRSYGTELMMCQRYYEKMDAGGVGGPYATWGSGYVGSSTAGPVSIKFAVNKRANPTISQGGSIRMLAGSGTGTSVSLTDSYFGTSGGYSNTTWTNSLTVGQAILVGANGDSTAYVAFSAEL